MPVASIEIDSSGADDGAMSVLSLAPLPTIVLVSVAAVVMTGCDASISFGDDVVRRVESETVPADDVTAIDISTGNGRIDVVGSASATAVDVDVIMREVDRGDADYSVDVVDGTLQLDGECDAAWHDPCSVGFVVSVPSDRDIEISTDNGAIALRGVGGDVDLRTDNGAIVATELTADVVEAQTDNGRIELSFDRIPDLVDARTDNGAIDIEVPDADYAVDADSDNGSVDVDVPRDDDAGHTIHASSDNGAIDIDTP